MVIYYEKITIFATLADLTETRLFFIIKIINEYRIFYNLGGGLLIRHKGELRETIWT